MPRPPKYLHEQYVMQSTKKIADAIIKYTPRCKRGRTALKKHIAEKLGISSASVAHTVQTIYALKGLGKPAKGQRVFFQTLRELYAKNKSFAQKIDNALRVYANMQIPGAIGYNDLLEEILLFLLPYKTAKRPMPGDEQIMKHIKKRIPQKALIRLAHSKGMQIDELILKAISEAGKSL